MRSERDPTANLTGIRVARISTVAFFIIAQLKTQIETIAAHGAQVTVVSSDADELKNANPIPQAAWKIIEIPRSISLVGDLIALVQLFLFFRREGIQIAHSVTPKAGLVTAVAAWLAGVPVRLHTFTGQPWVNLRGVKRWVVRGCDRLIGILNTTCYADSGSQRDFLLEQGLLKADHLNVISHGSLAGVDVHRFNRSHFPEERCNALRRSLGIPEQAAVLLFVGRITTEKGMRELLHAYAGIKSGGSDAHLVIVGKFDDASGMPGTITPDEITRHPGTHIVGYTDTPEAYMAIADLLCLPSYREGFGTVVIEAAAMGVPTVGSHIYGLSDAVVHGHTGVLVTPRDGDAVQAALEMLLGDDTLRARLGQQAMVRAQALFDADVVNAAVVQDYVDLLRNKGIAAQLH